jgi:hypothetical protein
MFTGWIDLLAAIECGRRGSWRLLPNSGLNADVTLACARDQVKTNEVRTTAEGVPCTSRGVDRVPGGDVPTKTPTSPFPESAPGRLGRGQS